MNKFQYMSLLACLSSASWATAETTPEKELQSARQQLTLTEKQAKTVGLLTATKKLAPFKGNVQASLQRARGYFQSADFAAASAEAKDFITASQSLETKAHLEALNIIAKSSERLGDERSAITYYRRYASAFISHKSTDYSQLTNNIKAMLNLASDTKDVSESEIQRIIAAVLSQKTPTHYVADIMYSAAITAMERGKLQLAQEWLEQAAERAPDSHLKARSRYFQGLMYLNQKKMDAAKTQFAKAIQEDHASAKEFAARSYLALARIAVKEKKLETALAYYGKIQNGSLTSRKAEFEKIYVILELNQTAEAKKSAEAYIANYPSGEASFALQNLLGYLQLRAGNWDQAITNIADHENRMLDDMGRIKKEYSRRPRMTESDLKSLNKKMAPYMRATPDSQAALSLFRRLHEAQSRISQLQGYSRDFNYTMGRYEIDLMRPQWQLQGEQLSRLSQHSLASGERISAAEQEYYKNQISPTDQLRLKSLRDLRQRLVTQGAIERNRFGHWRNWLNIAQIESRLVLLQNKLLNTIQEAQSTAYASQALATVDQLAKDQNKTHVRQSKNGYASIQRMREIARTERIRDITTRSGAQASKEFLISYAVLLKEDESILNSYRQKQVEPAAQAFAQDAKTAWKHWDASTKLIFTKFVDLKNGMNADVASLVSTVESHQQQQQKIMNELQKIKGHLEILLGDSTQELLSQFENAVQQQQAKHRKWKADIQWLKYSEIKSNREAESLKMATQHQMLKDNLNSLKQGAIW